MITTEFTATTLARSGDCGGASGRARKMGGK